MCKYDASRSHKKYILSHCYTATQEYGVNEQRSGLPLASAMINHTLLQLHNTGQWDNFIFKKGI